MITMSLLGAQGQHNHYCNRSNVFDTGVCICGSGHPQGSAGSPFPLVSTLLLPFPPPESWLILQLALWSVPISSWREAQWRFFLQGLTFIKKKKIKTRLFPANADGIYTLKYLSSLRVKLKGLKKWKTMFCPQAFSP